ncbi:LytR C-terminal domain-containing protein [Amycolatopsis sp. H20-H5]|uniref:LytR C-terminal domain-containing protein n=1 Tax=Amycolatopsis sp. H20-H5 TaxID=3046309 RepID=UPI002DB915F2|nr:LytR C-terminal domain-containing protein [Amycolatopsis sp. H20-H5]MEC3981520.1 LytR C-terminal domain-containing protein [Amycolatopsis sp. H20-H5]
MSVFSGLSRPLKAAGVALVAIAVVAAVIGGITVLNSGSSSDTAAPSSSAPSPGTPSGGPSVPPTGSPAVPPTSAVPPSTSAPSSPVPPSPTPGGQPPGQTGQPGQPGQPGNGQQSAKWVVVRVYNNSLITGLAAKAKKDFEASGWKVEDPKPYPYGTIPTTTAYYRPGTDEETAAKALAAEFGMRAEQRFEGIQDSSPGVVVILTKDYKGGDSKGS